MQIIDETTVMVNPANGLIDELLDATIDATDQAHAWGEEDATEGRRQDAACFPANSPAWAAYHEGYREGSIMAAILTGSTRRYWDPASPFSIQMVSWNSQPTAGLFKCPICGTYYNPTYGGCPGCANNVKGGHCYV